MANNVIRISEVVWNDSVMCSAAITLTGRTGKARRQL